jgi:ATP-dependent DNA helicase RecG
VVVKIQGRFLDENYSRTLLTHAELPWPEVLALDAVQKGREPEDDALHSLRKKGLVEGRKPALRVASDVAAATEETAEYIRFRAFDDGYFCDLILDYLRTFQVGRRADFERLLAGKLSSALSEKQKEDKINNLLQKLRKKGSIRSEGKTRSGVWVACTPPKPDFT